MQNQTSGFLQSPEVFYITNLLDVILRGASVAPLRVSRLGA